MMCRTVGLAKGILVVAALFALGCQSSGTTGGGGVTFICGNGVCEGTESSYCAQDCPGGGACTPACNGATCGSNGCGGSCGSCSGGQVCSGGSCKSSSTGPTCSNDCSTDVCLNSTTVSKCSFGGDGCKHAQSIACPTGQVCDAQAAICGPCSTNTDCPGKDVCDAGSCENPNGKKYVFNFMSATVPEKDTDGTAWDFPGGLPDPYACLFLDDVKIGCTGESSDTLSPYWNQSVETTVYISQTISIRLYDNEGTPDYMTGVEYNDTAGLLKKGFDSGAMPDAGYTLSFTVAPK